MEIGQASSRRSRKLQAVLLPPALFLLLSLQGCFSVRVPPYPEAWPAAVATPENQCPDVSGRYFNAGEVGGEFERHSVGGRPTPAGWNGDMTLAGNLIKMRSTDLSELQKARALLWVELTQPDADTLELHFPPFPPEGSHEPIVFTRNWGDFECRGSSLRFSTTGSTVSREKATAVGNILMTGVGLVHFSGGIVSTERSFRTLEDGSLSMEVTEFLARTSLILFSFGEKKGAFVRWERALIIPGTPGERVETAYANRAREEALRASIEKRPARPLPSLHIVAARSQKPHFKDEPGPEPFSTSETALTRSIQEGLRKVGYTWVPVDGRLGSWTRGAIRNFQSSDEYTGRFVDAMPSKQLLVDIERAIPSWVVVLQPPHQPADAEQK